MKKLEIVAPENMEIVIEKGKAYFKEIEKTLEVGKWYKDESMKGILLYLKNKDSGRYGFDSSGWYKTNDSNEHLFVDRWTEATHEEVKKALIDEAVKRGFVKGVRFLNEYGEIQTFNGFDRFYLDLNSLHSKTPKSELDNEKCFSNPPIFKKGKWAEIIEQQKLPEKWEDIVWDKEVFYLHTSCKIAKSNFENHIDFANSLPSKELAEAQIAQCKLAMLRDIYRDGWEPKDEEEKWSIYLDDGIIKADRFYNLDFFLSFQTKEIAELFLKNFREDIELYKPLMK